MAAAIRLSANRFVTAWLGVAVSACATLDGESLGPHASAVSLSVLAPQMPAAASNTMLPGEFNLTQAPFDVFIHRQLKTSW
eukprot:COSAG06_NODE_1340_length_9800_cov_40.231158_8_plen_81_part_00